MEVIDHELRFSDPELHIFLNFSDIFMYFLSIYPVKILQIFKTLGKCFKSNSFLYTYSKLSSNIWLNISSKLSYFSKTFPDGLSNSKYSSVSIL